MTASHGSLARSSVVVALFGAVGIVLGLGATVATASVFGASRAMDAYLAAAAIPTYATTILTGALGITFIPVFAEYRHTNPAYAWLTVSAFLNLALIVTAVIVVVGMVFALPIMRAAAPGFAPAEQARAAVMLRVYLPVVIVAVANELLASIYYSHQQFVVPLLNKVIAPSITIAYVVLLAARLDVMSLVIATLTGAILQCAILAVGIARKEEFKFVLTKTLHNEGVKKVVRLMGPLVAGMLIYKVVPVFDRFILSSLPPGSIAEVNYASKLQGAVVQILSGSVSLPVFPALAAIAAEGKWHSLKETMAKVIRLLFFVAVPFAVLLAVLGEPLVKLVYQRGAFSPNDTRAVFLCFALYMASLPVVTIGGVVSQGLYVLQDTRTVALVGVGETVLYIALCFLLVDKFTYLAPPIAYGIYFTVSVVVLGAAVRKRLGLGGGMSLARSCARYATLGIVVGVLALGARVAGARSEAGAIAWFAVLTLAYFGAARAMQSTEANLIWEKAHAAVLRLRRA